MTQTSVRQRHPSRARTRERSGPAPAAPASLREVSLDDRYLLERGRIFLSGVQALVRVPLDQHRADRRRGLSTATLVSGYQGSPLGGLDKELASHAEICAQHHLVHKPALNEELGATAAWGSQLAAGLPGARYDGVVGVWYGKAPGLDRAADALRHGNYAGVGAAGGGLAIVGDDPACKSSTLPSASEATLASMHLPVFFPGSVQEVLDLGLHAIACSRASGLWSALKIVTPVADATASAEVAPDRVAPVRPELAGRHVPNARFLPPHSPELERSLLGSRTELALAYARANDVNRIEGARDDAWLGIVAAGTGYRHLRQALADLGLDERALERAGVRILRLGMIWPLEPQIAHSFAAGLDEVLVVEEKGPFLESQLKEVLYGVPGAPRIVGKRDPEGAPLLRAELDLDADRIARAVASRLRQRVTLESVEARARRLDEGTPGPVTLQMANGDGGPTRTPSFCSGCPHSASTAAPDGELVGAGIGCHTMVLLSPEGRGELTGVTQMGGEGAQWTGIEPFTDARHFTQNIGDGTFFHSGSLAVRAAVAAGANVTYKLLANGTVAMTGGQDVEGGMDVPEMTRLLELEGVKRIVVTTEEPRRYRRAKLAACAEVRPRRDLDAVQRELAAVEGVTVLIHDGECAAELRRARKRGLAPQPAERVVINERVCEGCGDCGRKSGCMSVQPVETELGRKTRIHQSSCNLDRSCVDGDCPAFLTVVPAASDGPRAAVPEPPADLPEPRPLGAGAAAGAAETSIRMAGIGGTGVVTISQLLGMAALLDGLHVAGLDQTGLSQKGGPVTSDLRISREPIAGTGRASAARVDVLLGLDLLGAASPENLAVCDPGRTAAVISTSAVPTQRMIVDPSERFPALSAQLDPIDRATRSGAGFALDAQALSEALFGDHMQANAIVLGAAWQRGLLPVSLAALNRAVELNGAAVERNRAALAWGRACVADPDAVEAATRPPEPAAPAAEPWAVELAERAAGGRAELQRLLEFRTADLGGFGGKRVAREYAEAVATVRALEEERAPGCIGVTESFARGLHRLTAYKDEYEVARLHLDMAEGARIEAEMGELDSTSYNLHPPLLRALGMKRKLRLGGWFTPGLRALRAGRRLRATPLDPFGQTTLRRTERALPGEYREGVERALAALSPETHATCVDLCEAAELVRGYEDIKLAGVERFRERTAELLAKLEAEPALSH